MTLFVVITLLLILGKILCMVFNRMPTDVLALVIIAITLVTTTLPFNDALSCFSSTSVILVGVLSVLVGGLVHSGVLHWMSRYVLGSPKNYNFVLLRVLIPASLMSAFVSNLAVVQLLTSVIKVWSKRMNISASKLLIPLSYASTLGGLCTIIGNTSNLVVADFYAQSTGHNLGMFSPLIPGLFCMVLGMITIMVCSKFIPERRSPEESFESSSDYTVELLVPTDCPHVGETVEEAGLLHVAGGNLIEIVRFDREVISPVPQDEFILGGDRLVYSGQINAILELRETHGLVNATHYVFHVDEMDRNRKLQMATVDVDSPLVGQSMMQMDFEDRNNVVLVAIARQGERLTEIPREVVLQSGDTLLLEGQKLNPEHFTDSLQFFDHVPVIQTNSRTFVAAVIMLGMVLLSATGVMPLLNSCFLAALCMGVTRCFNSSQLQKSINWKVLMVFAGSVCLGRAIDVTGIAQYLADSIQVITGTNAYLSLAVIAFVATLSTELISNTTSAAVFAPIALHTAESLGVSPMPFIISLMLAVSCSFATPVGSETNTLVYGPGGYKFFDYFRIGICMNIVLFLGNMLITTLVYPF